MQEKTMKASEAGSAAKAELEALTELKAETVSSIQRQGELWEVTVDMIELHMTPNTRDVLAIYAVQLDDGGNLLGYRRMGRYVRSQLDISTD
jgi:hypothetical protein